MLGLVGLVGLVLARVGLQGGGVALVARGELAQGGLLVGNRLVGGVEERKGGVVEGSTCR